MKLIINGAKRLDGDIQLQGAKNSVLPILAAAVVNGKENVIHNCPRLDDVDRTLEILQGLGCKTKREGSDIIVDSSCADSWVIPEELMRRLRSSIIFLGAILSRFGRATVSMPGGCEIGNRPIDLHLKALEQMGVSVEENHGFIDCKFEKPRGLSSCETVTYIHLDFPSVGATENILLAACKINGETVVSNAAREPEICDLADFLNKMGVKVYGAGSDTIRIVGTDKMTAAEHTIIPDRIVGATYFAACACAGGRAALRGARSEHMGIMLSVLREMGCDIHRDGDLLVLRAPERISGVHTIRTMPYPGFPTDIQSPFMAALCKAEGTSVFVENIFENRYKHVEELVRMGADISTDGRVAVVRGVKKLSGARVAARDLRGGAALAAAALGADGETEISGVEYINRGYEDIAGALCALGADARLAEE